jgi:YD repeat-containing protein
MHGRAAFSIVAVGMVVSVSAAPCGANRGFVLKETHVQGAGMPWSVSWTDTERGRTRTLDYDAHRRLSRQFVAWFHGAKEYEERVDYTKRLWQSVTVSLPPQFFGRGSSRSTIDALFPAEIRKRLREGLFVAVGRERLDGRGVLHLRLGPATTATEDIWVDPSTYRELREVQRTGLGHAQITRFAWLPKTRANEAKTRLVAPRGFRHQRCTEALPFPGSEGFAGTGVTTTACRT